MNRIAPIVLLVLLALAGLQVWSSLGGGGGVATSGEVSEADLVEQTTTSLSQRTFVSLAPVPDQPASPAITRASTTTDSTDPDGSQTTDAGSTTSSADPDETTSTSERPPSTTTSAGGSSTAVTTSSSTATTDGPTSTSTTRRGSSTTATTQRPTTQRPTTVTSADVPTSEPEDG